LAVGVLFTLAIGFVAGGIGRSFFISIFSPLTSVKQLSDKIELSPIQPVGNL